MPGVTRPRRTLQEDDDLDLEDGSQITDGAASNGAHKRPRLDLDGDGTARNRAAVPGHFSQHQPGSILRVTVKNFVTYTAATFDMGPALNMVIGPNGTGKSTLVCAICLGLGWGTQHLGRAKELSEFVKHGCSEADIEIELKGHRGKTNPVIRRNIRREGNKSSWSVDRQQSTLKNVLAIAKSFSIQIDNLCQFLPQDRVVEFAQLSSVDLLASTQRAAAPPQMSEWHEELKRLRGDQKKSEKEQADTKQHLANLANRQNLQRADVERMRERAEVQDTLAMLEKIRPFAQYTIAKESAQEAAVRKTAADQELTELNKELAPSMKAMNSKKAYVGEVTKVVDQRKRYWERARSMEEDVERTYTQATADIEECEKERQGEQKGINDRKKDMERTELAIRFIQEQMREQPIEVDLPAFNEQIREKTRQIRELDDDIRDRQQARKDRAHEIGSCQQRKTHAEGEIDNLRSLAGQQTNKLRGMSQDTAKAWEWIQQNQDKFRARVYGPPVIECTIQDKRYVDAIESLFQNNHLTAITCTNRDDFQLLTDNLFKKLRLHEITLRTCTILLEKSQPPVPEQEMRALGLEGWALNYLEGPEPVLSMLCGELKLHQTGVMPHDITDQQYANLENSAVGSWVTSKANYQITRRREYGPGAVSTRVRDVNPARYWTSQPIDIGAERHWREVIDTTTNEMEELKVLQTQVDAGIAKLRTQITDLQKQKVELESEKAEQQRALTTFRALPSRLETLNRKLAQFRTQEQTMHKKLRDIARKRTDLIIKKGQLTVEYQRHVDNEQRGHSNLIAASVALIEAQSDLETITARSADVQTLLGEKQQEVQRLEVEKKKLREEAKSLMQSIKALTAREPRVTEFWNSMPEGERNRNPEQLELEIDSLQARLDSLHGGNPGAIKEFEKRATEIDRLKQKSTELDSNLTELDECIKTIRDQWEPQLDALIAQISGAFGSSFEKINCAGAVSIFKGGDGGGADRDFDTWSVQVQVRFREGEQMSILDSHRQSGGERAVSTIFYLMALQSLSRAPFRVVDEINQGMDPRNERVVHERMVDIACGDGDEEATQTSQYFLITPKLLTGLKYSPGMKVHCIASGEFMPKDGKELDFKALLNRMKNKPIGAAA